MIEPSERRVDDPFVAFVEDVEPRLSFALAAAYGPQVGREATADALAYAWENWDRLRSMENPAGYLYRVGQTSARRQRRRTPVFPAVEATELPDVEPALPVVMARLSKPQRAAVVLVHAQGYSEREAADLLDISRGTLRRHLERGMAKLRRGLEVNSG